MNAASPITAAMLCVSALFTSASLVKSPGISVLPLPLPHTCVGCEAAAVEDPTTGTVGGFRLVSQVPGFTITGSVAVVSKTCSPGPSDSTGQVCSPDGNCEFTGSFKAYGDSYIGEFHDDWSGPAGPCRFSMPAGPGGSTSLKESIEWVSACDGSEIPHDIRFYNNSRGDCTLGVLVGRIVLTGTCSACSGSPY
jgi:hypothetical protein